MGVHGGDFCTSGLRRARAALVASRGSLGEEHSNRCARFGISGGPGWRSPKPDWGSRRDRGCTHEKPSASHSDNGYTSELIAREAVSRGLKPILSGRTAAKVEQLAANLGLQARVFDLANAATTSRNVEGMGLVLHCAVPFSATAAPMMAACLAAHAHYLDITGEISVLEHARTLEAAARIAGIAVCPGVGFEVIPTDCVAAALKAALPDATHLALGFDSRSGPSGLSPGTAKTSFEGLAQGGKVRKDGRIISVPLAYKTRRIDFGDGEKLAMTIPWGDVSTAYATTGSRTVPRGVKVATRVSV
jgi:short subunit dehydrogenase-like uncharacterized protein